MKIALVHDWLVVYAGAERVLEQIVKCYADGQLYAVIDFLPKGGRGFINNKKVNTTFIQNLPLARRYYRQYLPVMPLAVEQLDLSQYDLIISNSYAVAKGVITGPNQLHICMCCSPIRYAWDLQNSYLTECGLNLGIRGFMAKWILHKIRLWDYRTANGVDEFIAISNYIAARIHKVYRRQSHVIYPPVDVERFNIGGKKSGFYLTSSRLVPYKRIDLIAKAFEKMPEKELVIIGDGPDRNKIMAHAGQNVKVLGHQPQEVLYEYLQKARAFIFAAEEDFGIAPLEAQACGSPVIAYGKGGVRETIRGLESKEPTGIFFYEQTVESIRKAVEEYEMTGERLINPKACRENAVRFNAGRFRQEFTSFVERRWQEFEERKGAK